MLAEPTTTGTLDSHLFTNMITFSKNEKKCILEYIKSSAIAPYR